jgi:hypothetical protein
MWHFLLLFRFTNRHAIMSPRKLPLSSLHIAVHPIVINLLVCKHGRGTSTKRWPRLLIFIGCRCWLPICTHLSVRRVSIVHVRVCHTKVGLVSIESRICSLLKLLYGCRVDKRLIIFASMWKVTLGLRLLLLRLTIEEDVPHLAALVPHTLLHELAHGSHVEALEGG